MINLSGDLALLVSAGAPSSFLSVARDVAAVFGVVGLAFLGRWLFRRARRARSGSDDRAAPQAAGRTEEKAVVEAFHKLYYHSQVWSDTYWLGVPTLKCPLDLWVYQEIIRETRPNVIVETGTAYGGSALFLACMCDLVGLGRVITIDIEEKTGRPVHNRITYLLGPSTSDEIVRRVVEAIGNDDRVMVILDSDHRRDHVLAELAVYSKLVTPGSYLIVEDTNIGHPVQPELVPGPREAVQEFLAANPDFTADRSRERFHLTFNPSGYLKKAERGGMQP
ncbi:MAG: class I SAM-dependent methyltransferase [Armatimonadota bacterium]|nr:MAG: class I SAM-dependent methyltransferase [Armatimonadota bacterium]